jgi:hypothetical protein
MLFDFLCYGFFQFVWLRWLNCNIILDTIFTYELQNTNTMEPINIVVCFYMQCKLMLCFQIALLYIFATYDMVSRVALQA